MLSEIARNQLTKAGWYEGRCIDISKYENAYNRLGLELFSAAKKFLSEFGDLTINDQTVFQYHDLTGVMHKEIHTSTSCIDVAYCGTDPQIIERTGKKVIRIGAFDHCEIYIYISEDGMFYANWYNYGLVAENTEQFWNEYYGEVYGRATWDDIAKGRGRKMLKRHHKDYV